MYVLHPNPIILCDQQKMSGEYADARDLIPSSDNDQSGSNGDQSRPRKFTLNTVLICVTIAVVVTLTVAGVITTIAFPVSVCSYIVYTAGII